MSIAALLAHATPRGIIPGQSGGSARGQRIGWEEVVASMGGMPPGATALLRRKYMLDTTPATTGALLSHALEGAVVLVPTMSERVATARTMGLVVGLALAIHCEAKLGHCPACKGRGHVHRRGGVLAECPRCAGTGAGEPSDAAKARACKVSPTVWSRRWGERYDAVRDMLHTWEADGLARMRRQLFGARVTE